MVERLRVFKGITELTYSECTIDKTNDVIVDKGLLVMEANSSVDANSVLDFKKKDGSTTVFNAQIIDKTEENLWEVELLTQGYELTTTRIEQVYTSTSPEDIVQDVVDNWTMNLTFASTAVSGITLDRYVAKGYGIDIIKDMIEVLQWQLRIDENNNVYFEPQGNIDNGVVFTNGSDFQITKWKDDSYDIFNRVRVVGGFESFNKTETIVGVGTVFSLTKKPSGSMVATVAAAEQDPDTYVVAADDLTVTFDSSVTNPTFSYSFDKPIVVDDQDDTSIADNNKERFKEVQAPWLNTTSDALRYAGELLAAQSTFDIQAQGIQPDLNFNISIGEFVTISDPVRDRSAKLVITRITYKGELGQTEYEFGPRETLLYDWQREVETRVKDLERRSINSTENIFARLFKQNMTVDLEFTEVKETASPQDTFILSHKTLSRAKTPVSGYVENNEADCSDNGNNGSWKGSGIDGSQFTITGWRLSAGVFNGADNFVDVVHSSSLNISADFSIALAVKITPLPGAETWIMNKWDGTDGYAVRINASDQVELIYSDSGTDTVFATSTALTDDTFQHVTFTKSGTSLTAYVEGTSDNTDTGGAIIGTNTNNLEIGKQSTNFSDIILDEMRLYNIQLNSSQANDLNNHLHVNNGMVGYWSFDNPKLGLRYSSKTVVT